MDNLSLFLLIFSMGQKSPMLDSLMIFASGPLLFLSYIFALLIAIKGGVAEKKAFLLGILSLPVTIILIKLIHVFYLTDRPFVLEDITPLITLDPNASFPSRHSALIFSLAFSFLLYKSKWSAVLVTLALWVAFSRIYVGVHFPTDILGGIIIGLLGILITRQIKKLLI